MELHFISENLLDTDRLGEIISNNLFIGAVITLNGDLGAGKTTLTKAIGKYLGVKEEISSPTFNILKCYFSGKYNFYHIDAYRLEDGINKDIGLEEVIEGDGVALIEWSIFIPELVFEPLDIKIKIIDETRREFIISSDYDKYFVLLNKIKEALNVF